LKIIIIIPPIYVALLILYYYSTYLSQSTIIDNYVISIFEL